MGKRSKKGGAREAGEASAPASPPAVPVAPPPPVAPEEDSLDEQVDDGTSDEPVEGTPEQEASTPTATAEPVQAEVINPLPPGVVEMRAVRTLERGQLLTADDVRPIVVVEAPVEPTGPGPASAVIRCRARTTVGLVRATDEAGKPLSRVREGAVCLVRPDVYERAQKHLERL